MLRTTIYNKVHPVPKHFLLIYNSLPEENHITFSDLYPAKRHSLPIQVTSTKSQEMADLKAASSKFTYTDVSLIKDGEGMEGEVLSIGPMKIRILEDGRNTDNRIGTMILNIKGKTKGPPIHVCIPYSQSHSFWSFLLA